jgi:hypothetical protein
MAKDLEKKVMSKDIVILPEEQYVPLFTKKYGERVYFRKVVHKYLSLSKVELLKLEVGGVFARGWYQKKIGEIITQYAHRTREDLVTYRGQLEEREKAEEELRIAEEEAKTKKDEKERLEEMKDNAEEELNTTQSSLEHEKEMVDEEFVRKKDEEKERARTEKERIKDRTDARKIVADQVMKHIESSGMIRRDESGMMSFNEETMAKKLEDVLLYEVVEEVEKQRGAGFLTKARGEFNKVLSGWGELEDLDEMGDIDWTETVINSRSQGFKYPRMQHFITAKYEGRAKASLVTHINSGIGIDRSGSMAGKNMEMAAKAGLSLRAMMRKMSPDNETSIFSYSSYVSGKLTTPQVLELVGDGGTRTDLMMKTLLDEFKDKGPANLYIITDGAPDNVDDCINVASEYKQYPNVRLVLYLIDGDKNTEENIRKIGKAAGQKTKVANIKNFVLPGGMLMDVVDSMSEIYDISNF